MKFVINSLDNGCSFTLETEDAVLGGFFLDSISLPFGKRPDLMKTETFMMLCVNLTTQEIDKVALSLMHMAHNKKIGRFIQNIMSLKEGPCVVPDVTGFVSGNFGWCLDAKIEGAGITE
jgi:hypothetical protein